MGSRARVLAAIVCGAPTACGLVFSVAGYEGPLDGGVPEEADVVDAGGPPPGSEGGDAPGDTSPATTTDQRAESSTSFCPAGAIFCDDFTRSNPQNVQGMWGSESQMGGTLSILPAAAPVAFPFLRSAVTAGTVGIDVGLSTTTTVTIATRVTMAFQVRVDASLTTAGVHPAAFAFSQPNGNNDTAFPYFNGTALVIGEVNCVFGDETPCNYAMTSMAAGLEAGSWHSIVFSVDFTGSQTTYVVSLDGVQVIDEPSPQNIPAGPLSYSAGAIYIDATHPAGTLDIGQFVITGS
jgi:hypothetical protein